jgi:hypothetical protein
MSKKIICNVSTGEIQELMLTPDELLELEERKANSEILQSAPTKEDLLAQLNALAAQIQALE